jgi:hypothetical protein
MLGTAIGLTLHTEFGPVMSHSNNNKIPITPDHIEQVKISTHKGNGTTGMAIHRVRNRPSDLSHRYTTHRSAHEYLLLIYSMEQSPS